MDIKISASLMCADLSYLKSAVHKLEDCGVEWLHFDVMDGSYVPNFALGPLEMQAIRSVTSLPFDVHLMINQPERHVEMFAEAGANYLTIHPDATKSPLRTLQAIRSLGLRAGLALRPTDSLDYLRWTLPYVDMVLVMTVEPGFAGQAYVTGMDKKVAEVSELIASSDYQIEIEVDGNINKKTIPALVSAGATVLVGGSSGLFRKDISLPKAVAEMQEAAKQGLRTLRQGKQLTSSIL